MTKDVYCIRCGTKHENVQFSKENTAYIRCENCGEEFTVVDSLMKVFSGIPIYTMEEVTKVYGRGPSLAETRSKNLN